MMNVWEELYEVFPFYFEKKISYFISLMRPKKHFIFFEPLDVIDGQI
jgi:hypothetical protein